MRTSEQKEKRIATVFIKGGSFISLALAIMAILGWIFDITQLASFGSDKIPMALSTAVLFAAYGLVILFYRRLSSSKISLRLAIAFSYFGVFFALLMLYLSLNGIRLSAEHLGITLSGQVDGLVVGHMSPVTAFCFLLTGLACLIFFVLKDRKKLNSNVLLLPGALILITIIFLLSYLFGTPLLYGGSFIPPALPTTSAFLFLGIALLFILGLRVWEYEDLADALNTRQTFILALIFIVLVVSITTVGYSYYKSYEKHYRMEMENQLSSIAELKVSELVQWRKERLGDASIFYKNPNFSDLVKNYFRNPNDLALEKRIHIWMKHVHTAYEYNQVCLHDTDGKERLFFPNQPGPHGSLFFNNISEAIKFRKVLFEDFYLNELDKHIYLNISIPIIDDLDTGKVIGILALRIDPEQYLYPLINKWPTPSKTAETLIIRREGNKAVFLNELRFQKNTALNLRRPLTEIRLPAVQAARGRKGIFEGVDYRGVPVIAYVCPIPNSPWFLVARMDISEVFEPLNERLWLLLLFISILLIGTGSTIALVWHNQQERFYNEKYLAEKRRTSLQNIISKSLNEIYVFNSETLKFNYANDGAINNLGYSMKELEEMTPLSIKPKFTITSFKEMAAPLFEKKLSVLLFETIHRRKDGSEYDVEVHLQLIDSEMGLVFLAIVNDITERKLAEDALHKHSERLHNLHRIDQAILQALESPEAVVQTAIQHIRKLLQCQRVSVGIFDQEKREASVYTIDTDSKAIVQEGKIPIEHICANIDTLRETKIEIIENRSPLLSTTQIKNSLHAEGIESSINVALVSALEMYGVLNIGWENPRTITLEETEIASEVASQITIAIEKAGLLKETKRYAGELEQRVAQRTSQLEEVNKELESFSYSVSHDLRAPLRHISGFVGLLTRRFDESLPAKAKHYLESIADSAHQMGTLIDDLLQFSRTSHQEMVLSELDMEVVLQEALDQIKLDIKNQNIEWVIAPLPKVVGDKSLLRLVWLNLLSNAVKFTRKKEKTRIEINSSIHGDEIVFSVKDNGVGFDMKYSQKLFGVFQRLHSTETFEGTGIGLANVKRIILKHGGCTWAEAEPDKGATFYFTLPYSKEKIS